MFLLLIHLSKCVSPFCICWLSIALWNCPTIYFLPSSRLLWNIEQKTYFTDHGISNAIRLIVTIKSKNDKCSHMFIWKSWKLTLPSGQKTCLNLYDDVREMVLAAIFFFEQVFVYRICSHHENVLLNRCSSNIK